MMNPGDLRLNFEFQLQSRLHPKDCWRLKLDVRSQLRAASER